MLLAISVGNTNTAVGAWDGTEWAGIWRQPTHSLRTSDDLCLWLTELLPEVEGQAVDALMVASVVPEQDAFWAEAARTQFQLEATFLRANMDLGVPIRYRPQESLGADRLAGVLGALERLQPPLIVVDFGTATTINVVDSSGAFVGGAILPGAGLAASSLLGGTAQLPEVALKPPDKATGSTTEACIRSGVVLGHAFAVDGLVLSMASEMAAESKIGPDVLATGGLAPLMLEVCQTTMEHVPELALEGLVAAHRRIGKG